MPPRKPKTAVNGAATFDFDAFLTEFERPQFTRNLYRKGKLVPKLATMGAELDDLETRIDRLEKAAGDDDERDITAVDPLSELKRRRAEATEAWNAVAEEFEASAVPFTFRIPDDKDDHEQIQALMVGFVQPEEPAKVDTGDAEADTLVNKANAEQYTKELAVWWDALAIRSMSVTCVSHSFTVDQWEALRKQVGLVAFANLMEGWAEAVQAAKPAAPFLRRPSVSPELEG
jgi:hypothetical protein